MPCYSIATLRARVAAENLQELINENQSKILEIFLAKLNLPSWHSARFTNGQWTSQSLDQNQLEQLTRFSELYSDKLLALRVKAILESKFKNTASVKSAGRGTVIRVKK